MDVEAKVSPIHQCQHHTQFIFGLVCIGQAHLKRHSVEGGREVCVQYSRGRVMCGREGQHAVSEGGREVEGEKEGGRREGGRGEGGEVCGVCFG